jgi:hypothetical protein
MTKEKDARGSEPRHKQSDLSVNWSKTQTSKQTRPMGYAMGDVLRDGP